MTYSEKLRDPRWQKKRLLIFERDHFACVSCGEKNKPIAVHHIVYRRLDPWDYPDYLYQTLCEDCHEKRQELIDKATEAFRVLLKDVPTVRIEKYAQNLFGEAMKTIGDSQ